jgi:GrpB-like predicted nucleotidyltransferase (UPF0157 family)
MLLRMPNHVLINDYDETWAVRGPALAADLRTILGPTVLRAEHIGSTSIPGMAAKPIYDLQLSVHDLDEAVKTFDGPLTQIGFTSFPYHQDHVPAGSDDAPPLWRKRLWGRRGGPGEDVNLHVRLRGAPNERLALLFRDWFRAHPEAIAAYAAFKRVLAGSVGEAGVYTEVKDPVVDLIVGIAESWAHETSWRL